MSFGGLLDGFGSAKALIVGDVMLDEYIFGSATRISPEAPVMVVRHERSSCVPGGAANVARNVQALGGHATLIGVVGEDEGAERLRQSFDSELFGACAFVADARRRTTRKTRVLADHSHQVLRIDAEDDDPIEEGIEQEFSSAIERAMDGCQVLVFSDYLKGALTENVVRSGLEAAKRRGIPVVVNPKPRSLMSYRGSTLVSLNRSEATEALGLSKPLDKDQALDAANRLRSVLELDGLLITLGGMGMAASIPEPVRVEARQVEVADPAGAGDTVIATVALGVATVGLGPEVFELAAETSAAVVRHVGVAAPSQDDLDRLRRA